MIRRIAFVLAALATLLSGCAGLPPLESREFTVAIADTQDTRFGRAVAADAAANPGKTGIHPLLEPLDAFAARVLLAGGAEKSLDVQYYIWNNDQVGNLLFEALWQAAERGVRVRLLLDDMNTGGLDPMLAALDAHANIEVRLYNPFVQRDARILGLMTDFGRLNRRMHNKSFTADSQVSVLGGRNVGNEYYAAGTGLAFSDLDVVAVGAAVRGVSRQFDLYWNCAHAYPVAGLLGAPGPEGTALLRERIASARADPVSEAFLEAVRTAPFVQELLARRLAMEWTPATLIHDDPAKTGGTTDAPGVLLFPELVRTMGRPEKSLDMVSPYFVPGEEGAEGLAALARRGVRVRILTNSLASSEASVVYSGYAKRRIDLLRAGVELFEFRPSALREASKGRTGIGSSSASALHAKTFSVDRSRIFVGSFNFDLRSAFLNTEMGLVIENANLAQKLSGAFDAAFPGAAYEVRLQPDGSLVWIEQGATGDIRHDTEPEAGWFRRFGVTLLSLLPLDWML